MNGPHPEPLVRCKGAIATLPAADLVLDPHLAIYGHRSLLLPHVSDTDNALHYLGHRIVHYPHELRSHVQRILLLIRKQDGAALYGALIDLFIALGNKGLALKRDLLALATPLLTPASLASLQDKLEDGILACDPGIARVRSALLRAGTCQNEPLVHRHRAQPPRQARGPLDEAQELLAYGQLDQALETLENALLMNPDQPDIAMELRELYLRMGEVERMEAMREQLLINFGRAPDSWPPLSA